MIPVDYIQEPYCLIFFIVFSKKAKRGPTRARTGIIRFKVWCTNHYTIEPVGHADLSVDLIFFTRLDLLLFFSFPCYYHFFISVISQGDLTQMAKRVLHKGACASSTCIHFYLFLNHHASSVLLIYYLCYFVFCFDSVIASVSNCDLDTIFTSTQGKEPSCTRFELVKVLIFYL